MMFKVDREQKFRKTDIPKTVRFTERIDNDLLALQQKTGVSFNQLVLQCCRFALDNLDKDN